MPNAQEPGKFDLYIRNIAIRLRYMNDSKLAEYGITKPQAELLRVIKEGNMEDLGVSRKYLEEITLLRGPSVTSLLNALEKSGFITREPRAADRRALVIRVTDKGESLISDMCDVFTSGERQLLAGMTDEEKENFLALLKRASENMTTAHG
jgi:DNA-binding MarR family transcriptional regulator